MRTLDNLRAATNNDVVHAMYESVERVKSQLDSDTYCEMMNAMLVVRERLHVAPFIERVRPPPEESGPVMSEHDREERIVNAIHMKLAIERQMSVYRRSHRNILRTIGKLERQRVEPLRFRDESPIIIM